MAPLTVRRLVAPTSAAALLLVLVTMSGGQHREEAVADPTAQPLASLPRGCRVTPQAAAEATIEIEGRAFGPSITVRPGAAVAFVNRDATSHTVTEGIAGHADYDTACVTRRLRPRESIVVTFEEPGDYPITCTIHASMQTTVHVS